MIDVKDIISAYDRINRYIHKTPILTSNILNNFMGGHEFFFKIESLQKIGAFKSRGAFNKIIKLREENNIPKKIVATSSGNHAQGIALACKEFSINSTIYMNESTSELKVQAVKSYGSNVILTKTNQEAEEKAKKEESEGAYYIHPFDDDQIIAGQGTVCYEALKEIDDIDAIFVPCGGGLLSGTFIASKIFSDSIKVFAGEPKNCNDAYISLKEDKLHIFNNLPQSIADGVRTLSISARTFSYLKKTKGIIEVSEEDIIYWTQWIQHLLKISCEPSSSVAMAACHKWISLPENRNKKFRILIIITGGNISAQSYKRIWDKDYLTQIPSINL